MAVLMPFISIKAMTKDDQNSHNFSIKLCRGADPEGMNKGYAFNSLSVTTFACIKSCTRISLLYLKWYCALVRMHMKLGDVGQEERQKERGNQRHTKTHDAYMNDLSSGKWNCIRGTSEGICRRCSQRFALKCFKTDFRSF